MEPMQAGVQVEQDLLMEVMEAWAVKLVSEIVVLGMEDLAAAAV